jgi:hypothetical protein
MTRRGNRLHRPALPRLDAAVNFVTARDLAVQERMRNCGAVKILSELRTTRRNRAIVVQERRLGKREMEVAVFFPVRFYF